MKKMFKTLKKETPVAAFRYMKPKDIKGNIIDIGGTQCLVILDDREAIKFVRENIPNVYGRFRLFDLVKADKLETRPNEEKFCVLRSVRNKNDKYGIIIYPAESGINNNPWKVPHITRDMLGRQHSLTEYMYEDTCSDEEIPFIANL